jgi:hypothetical protein
MSPLLRLPVVLAVLLLCTSCAQITYKKTGKGEFVGDLDVRWNAPDCFIYIPSATNPLRFTASDKKVITPEKMYTDGGSVPRILWGIPGLSPWGYAPAYIVHDWLFEAHHQDNPEYRDITFDRSAEIIAEGIKTLMESRPDVPKDETILWAIYEAVKTPIAKSLWDKPANREVSCGPSKQLESLGRPPGVLLFKVRFEGGSMQHKNAQPANAPDLR